MTAGPIFIETQDAEATAPVSVALDEPASLPEGWSEIRADPDVQFTPIEKAALEPREPSAFWKWLERVFEAIGDFLSPIGGALGSGWSVIQWVLYAILAAIVVYALIKLAGPIARARRGSAGAARDAEPEWTPDEAESIELLGDADALAAEGRYDEAARLLLHRSVGQIKAARPDWVDPSSTARELAALPALSDAARRAFSVISQAVERSLFALQSLNAQDWEQARAAYADFALARIETARVESRRLEEVA
ncbi:MAG: hypothetical protein AAF127_08265 [Pseudomonadota bacterium]